MRFAKKNNKAGSRSTKEQTNLPQSHLDNNTIKQINAVYPCV